MRKPQLKMLICYMTGLLILGLSAWLTSGLLSTSAAWLEDCWFWALIPSLFVLAMALLFLAAAEGSVFQYWFGFKARRGFFHISYLLNAAASGYAVGVLMAEKGMLPTNELFLALLPAAALGLLLAVAFLIPGRLWHKTAGIAFLVLAIALIGCGIYTWIRLSPLAGCAAVFSGLYFLLFPVGIQFALKNPQEWYRYLSYTGFGAFLIIIGAAIVILSEGEALEGLDIDIGWGSRKKKYPK